MNGRLESRDVSFESSFRDFLFEPLYILRFLKGPLKGVFDRSIYNIKKISFISMYHFNC